MKQGLFEVYGTGRLGLKAEDQNENYERLTSVGLRIPSGVVIAVDIFDELITKINFEESFDLLKEYSCPDFLLSINEQILAKMELWKPYAIRSSALSESGGIGIYTSEFFVPCGQTSTDMRMLWHCELAVYKSEFTSDAKLWREKNKSPMGMAILIQPVTCPWSDTYYRPTLSGVAYTSYNGLPTIRVVVGLGTKAVKGGGFIYHDKPEYVEQFISDICTEQSSDAISIYGKVINAEVDKQIIDEEIELNFDVFNNLFKILDLLKKDGDLYLEWAISDQVAWVVQCSKYQDKLPVEVAFDKADYFLLFEGQDVVNAGQATCESIVYVNEWSPIISMTLENLNTTLRDYLLIIKQDAFSVVSDIRGVPRLAFRHFSNALTVVEKQRAYSEGEKLAIRANGQGVPDHSSGAGATHFSQLCDKTNILFIGGEFDPAPIFSLPGRIDHTRCEGIYIWRRTVEVVVDTVNRKGSVYIQKKNEIVINYTIFQVQEWSFALRNAANNLEKNNPELSNYYYTIHYLLCVGDNPIEFNPFSFEEAIKAEPGGVAWIIDSLKSVIATGGRYIPDAIWDDGLKTYLEEILVYLKK